MDIQDLKTKVCYVLQANKNKTDKIELFQIYRVISNPKIFPDGIPVPEEEFLNISTKNPDLINLVKLINPFFKFDNEIKVNFYKKNFYISTLIFNEINKLFLERNEVKYYSLYDCTNKTEVFYENIPKSTQKGLATFFTIENALAALKKYSAYYESLGLELKVSIRKHNSMNGIIEEVDAPLD